MSSYQILSTKDYNPLKIGKKGRFLQYILLLLIFVIPSTISLFYHRTIPTYAELILFFGLLLIIGLITIRLKTNRKKLQSIGSITFSTNSIQKNIKNFSSSYNYEELKMLKLEKHLPAVTSVDSIIRCITYKMIIIPKHKPQEKLIVSDMPDDNKKISIIKALRYIEKKYPIKVKIDI